MKALVTGAAGFLGRHLIDALVERGMSVRGLDVEPGPIDDWIQGSVIDLETVAKAVEGIDLVIHAAAVTDLWSRERFAFDRINVIGTCRVLAAARRVGARVVLVSSYTTLVSSRTPKDALLNEEIEVPANRLFGAYPRSKRQAELAALSAAAAGQFVSIVQPGAPVGIGDARPTPPGRLILDFMNGRLPALLECKLNLVDVRAVADATIQAGVTGQSGRRYLLTGQDVDIGDLAATVHEAGGAPAPKRRVPYPLARLAAGVESVISRITGRTPNAPVTGVRLAGRPCRFDNSRAREELGFAPRPIDECVGEAVAWFRANGGAD